MFKQYEHVKIGAKPNIQDFVTIGLPFSQDDSTIPLTTLGDYAKIRSHTVIYAGNQIADYFATGHMVLVREHNHIGSHVSIGSHSTIEHHIVIEDHVRIHSQAFIPEFSHIEEAAWIGPKVCLTNAKLPGSSYTKQFLQGPRISKQARIGANATILPGIVIGQGALVGAGSVVTKDVPAGMVVVGNPARILCEVSKLRFVQDSLLMPYHETVT